MTPARIEPRCGLAASPRALPWLMQGTCQTIFEQMRRFQLLLPKVLWKRERVWGQQSAPSASLHSATLLSPAPAIDLGRFDLKILDSPVQRADVDAQVS